LVITTCRGHDSFATAGLSKSVDLAYTSDGLDLSLEKLIVFIVKILDVQLLHAYWLVNSGHVCRPNP